MFDFAVKLHRYFVAKFITLYDPHNELSMGKKTPRIAPCPWDFVTPLEQNRAMAIHDNHKKFGKDRACGS